MKTRTFVDEVTLQAAAGAGGNGCCSFRREKFVPHGGPDGGDGGRGGHVILRGDRNTDCLIGIYYAPVRIAKHGGHGKGKQLYGRRAKDVVIRVPLGTVIRDSEEGYELGEILEHDQEFIVAHGGKGGLGNIHFKSSTHQAPMEHTDGEPGESHVLRLELKVIADLGLVGFPNAGKSSLISKLTGAHPKVGAYPFTTLNPIIGTIKYEDWTQVTVADIPGLISGAHDGAGLGHSFLRHIERSKILVYVIDMAATDGRNPYEDYQTLRQELQMHKAGLVDRPSILVANKMDAPEAAENLKTFKRKTRTKPLVVSALTGDGVPALHQVIREVWDATREGA